MANDALEFATDDTDFTAKMNRKTVFVGTGTQINSIVNTYAGQRAFCTSTGSGFTINRYYLRDATNTSWTTGNLTFESSEQSTTPITDNAQIELGSSRYYTFFTLPTTEEFYIITKFEWKNGATGVSGTVICGADIVDANPPVDTDKPLVALSNSVAQTGTSSTQSVTMIACNPIRGGTTIGAWLHQSAGSGNWYRYVAVGLSNNASGEGFTTAPPSHVTTAWSQFGIQIYFKVYYRGYIGP